MHYTRYTFPLFLRIKCSPSITPTGVFFSSLWSPTRSVQGRSDQEIQPRRVRSMPATDEGWGWG